MAVGKVAGTVPAQVASVPWPQCPAVVSDGSPHVPVTACSPPCCRNLERVAGWWVQGAPALQEGRIITSLLSSKPDNRYNPGENRQ